MLSTIIGSGISAIGGIASSIFGHKSNNSTNHTNLQIARETNELNRELYYHNLEYNSPKAQMQRLEEAGLNPQLVYGGNANVINTNSHVPEMKGAEMKAFNDYSSIANLGKQLADIYLLRQQVENLKTENQNKRLQNVYQEIENGSLQFDVDLKKELRETSKQRAFEELHGIKIENLYKQVQNDLSSQQIRNLAKELEHTEAKLTEQQARNKLWKAGINPNNSALDNFLKQMMANPSLILQMLVSMTTTTFGGVRDGFNYLFGDKINNINQKLK